MSQLLILEIESLTRYDISLEECTEASLQSMMQLVIYLTIQLVVASTGVKPDDNYKLSAIWISVLLSTISLTLGQVKV